MAVLPDLPTMIAIMMETALTKNSLSELSINLEALAANYHFLAEQSAPSECAAVVKANAYGLGLRAVTRALEKAGCKTFFVATLDEGLALRTITKRTIYVFAGVTEETKLALAEASLRPVLNSIQQVELWNSLGPAALHLDTGMNRLGLSKKDFLKLSACIANGIVIKPTLILSHLACADEPSNDLNLKQLKKFKALRTTLQSSPRSLSASSGIFLGPRYHFDMVRPGYALYGGNPTKNRPNPMNSVIKLKARILQCREVARGETVGYGATFRSDKKRQIATIAIGYGDGYLRALAQTAYVSIKGILAPVAGRISMDLISVDITGIEGVKPGDWAEIIGSTISVDDLAKCAGTIGYELLTTLGPRHKRIYIGADI